MEQARIDAELADTRYREVKMRGLPEEVVKKAAYESRRAEQLHQEAQEVVLVIEYRLRQLPREVAPPPRPVRR